MRISNISSIAAFIIIAASCVFAQEAKMVQPKEKTGVYENQIRMMYEQPIVLVTPDEYLVVIKTKGDFYQVKTSVGLVGWIEKRLVKAIGKSKTFRFEGAEVVGYLDNPTPVYILDSDDPNAERIYLDRSFRDALRDNTDKEHIERQASK